MSTKTAGYVLIGGIAAYFLYKKFVAADTLTYKIYNLVPNPIIVGQPLSLVVTFLLSNPTDTPISIGGITGNVFVNGTLLSNISSTDSVTVPANNSGTYPVNFTVSVNDAVLQLVNLLKNNSAIVSFIGNIIVAGVSLPFNDSMTI